MKNIKGNSKYELLYNLLYHILYYQYTIMIYYYYIIINNKIALTQIHYSYFTKILHKCILALFL